MVDFILHTIFWTLAIYGLFEIIKNIIYVYSYTKLKSSGLYLIVATKNQEEQIEGFMRSMIFKILYGKEDTVKSIILADLNSNDDTKKKKKKLADDYDIIKATTWKECKEIMDNIDSV